MVTAAALFHGLLQANVNDSKATERPLFFLMMQR
jgi:hypothetical protein